VLHPDLINANMKAAQYAVRGELYLKGEELRKSGREILYTNGEEFGREKKEREKEREDIIFSFPRVDKDLEKRSPRDPVNTFRFLSFLGGLIGLWRGRPPVPGRCTGPGPHRHG
jgi:hypothetical protein